MLEYKIDFGFTIDSEDKTYEYVKTIKSWFIKKLSKSILKKNI